MRSVENRIAFATANVKCACKALTSYPSIFGLVGILMVVQVLWFLLWTSASSTIYELFRSNDPTCQEIANDPFRGSPGATGMPICGGAGAGVTFFFLLISVYWGQQVIQNVSTCTIAGTVATWWYQSHIQSKSVPKALRRSLTTSFGSICFGSLIVAVVQALRTVRSLILLTSSTNS